MELRSERSDARPSRAARFVVWAVVAVTLLAGIALALLFGPEFTPVFDTLR